MQSRLCWQSLPSGWGVPTLQPAMPSARRRACPGEIYFWEEYRHPSQVYGMSRGNLSSLHWPGAFAHAVLSAGFPFCCDHPPAPAAARLLLESYRGDSDSSGGVAGPRSWLRSGC